MISFNDSYVLDQSTLIDLDKIFLVSGMEFITPLFSFTQWQSTCFFFGAVQVAEW